MGLLKEVILQVPSVQGLALGEISWKNFPQSRLSLITDSALSAYARSANMSIPDRTVRLRFCPNSDDLLYPKEDRARNKLVYVCRNCDYTVDSESSCVYRHHITHSALETTTILADVTTDPTLPISKGMRCDRCKHNEAVFFSMATSEGMSLFFQCKLCAHKWKDTGDAVND